MQQGGQQVGIGQPWACGYLTPTSQLSNDAYVGVWCMCVAVCVGACVALQLCMRAKQSRATHFTSSSFTSSGYLSWKKSSSSFACFDAAAPAPAPAPAFTRVPAIPIGDGSAGGIGVTSGTGLLDVAVVGESRLLKPSPPSRLDRDREEPALL